MINSFALFNKAWKRLALFTIFWVIFWYGTVKIIPFKDKELGSATWFMGIRAWPLAFFVYACLDWLFSQRVLKGKPGRMLLILSFMIIVTLLPLWWLTVFAASFIFN